MLDLGGAAAAGPAALADVAGTSPAATRTLAARTAPARWNAFLWVRRICMIASPSWPARRGHVSGHTTPTLLAASKRVQGFAVAQPCCIANTTQRRQRGA